MIEKEKVDLLFFFLRNYKAAKDILGLLNRLRNSFENPKENLEFFLTTCLKVGQFT